ncbi:MAG: hypothetical protein IPM42_20705 [Saprospiraceae bacterium]|nr:hypothetical protein [Saprospiraceae bacterium]
MKNLIYVLILLPFIGIGQSFPSDAKVLQDVKKYHGKIASADVQNDWKLEREDGYNFSNMAKRVVAGTTVKENGISKKIIGLAIYTRGGAGESWNFSRYFVTGSEVVSAKSLTSNDLRQQTIDLLNKEPIKVFVDFQNISWVYDINYPDITQNRTDRTGDMIYNGFIDYERKFNDSEGITLPNYPFEAGLQKFSAPVEAYVRLVDGEMKVAVVSMGYSAALDKKMMSRKDYENLPSLANKPFDQLFGNDCPFVISGQSIPETDKPSSKQSGAKTEKEESTAKKPEKKTKKIGFPKFKIN